MGTELSEMGVSRFLIMKIILKRIVSEKNKKAFVLLKFVNKIIYFGNQLMKNLRK